MGVFDMAVGGLLLSAAGSRTESIVEESHDAT